MNRVDQIQAVRAIRDEASISTMLSSQKSDVAQSGKYGIIGGERSVTADEIWFATICVEQCKKAGIASRFVLGQDRTRQFRLLCEVTAANRQLYLTPTKRVPVSRGELSGYRLIEVSPWNPKPDESRPWRKVLSLKVSHG